MQPRKQLKGSRTKVGEKGERARITWWNGWKNGLVFLLRQMSYRLGSHYQHEKKDNLNNIRNRGELRSSTGYTRRHVFWISLDVFVFHSVSIFKSL